MEKSAEINYHALRKVWQEVEKDWEFSMPEIRETIKKKGLKYWETFKTRKLPYTSYFLNLFDPRTDFPIK